MTTTSDEALEEYDALVMAGKAPTPREFAERYPNRPELIQRIEALEALRAELDAMAGHIAVFDEDEAPDEIAGYRLIESIGRGGMGRVFRAQQVVTGRQCALKLMRRASPVAIERFRREAQLASHLDHPGIADVWGTGMVSGRAYLVTELVVGASLADMLRRAATRRSRSARRRDATLGSRDAEVPAPPSTVRGCVALAHQVADALAHAHARGVVHRDVKPSNIMVTPGGRVRLIDFGIALATGDLDRITRTGVFLGSHEYAAPEQLRGDKHEIGPWTDCYALGATLFELLTLKTPFSGLALGLRIARAGDRPAATPRSLNRSVDRTLDSVVMRALHPTPRKRFRDGAHMAKALASWLARRSG